MAFSSKAFTLLRSVGRGAVTQASRFTSTHASSSGFSSRILPFLAGSVTAVCVASGASYYTSKVCDSGVTFGILETVQASAAPPPKMPATKSQRTFIMIKPDGVHRSLIADIIKRFEQRGYKLVAMKFMKASETLLKDHYADLSTKEFFPSLIKFMSSGPVVAMVWEGTDIVKQGRAMLGETDPLKSKPGSIRGDFSVDIGRNIVHGSDSTESAKKEIGLWFKEDELVTWDPNSKDWVYE